MNLEEFIRLFLEADEKTKRQVEKILTEDQRQHEFPEKH